MPLRQPAHVARISMVPRRGRTLTTSASNAHTLASTAILTMAGTAYAIVPGALSSAAAGVVSPGFGPLWVAGLIVGGLLSTAGVIMGRAKAQVVGLALLGASVCFAAGAIVDTRTPTAIPAALIYLSSGLSCFARIWGIVYLERLRDRIERAARAHPPAVA